MKKYFFLIPFFLFFLNCHAINPANQCVVVLYRDPASSVIMNAYSVTQSVNFNQSQLLIGSGSNKMCLGELYIVLYSTTNLIPHTLELTSSTYDSSNQSYVAYNSTNKLKIGVYRDFNNAGTQTGFTLIEPTTNPIVLRTSNNTIQETHLLRFCILQDPINNFVNGTYTASFTLFFYTP
ncbi:MAG: hypothetical protein S4CHLAM20_15550 [Chlamydiia bacterium]|nr:hypothetical protein [Chlamydiia bacterium]